MAADLYLSKKQRKMAPRLGIGAGAGVAGVGERVSVSGVRFVLAAGSV